MLQIARDTKMSENTGFKALVGKRMTKEVKFMGEKVIMRKLSVAEVLEIQTLVQSAEKDTSDNSGFEVLQKIVMLSVEGADGISAEDFNQFPMDELTTLSGEIMKFSGIDNTKATGAGK